MTRVAIVSGGSRGIGRAITCALVKSGHAVGVLYRERAAAAEELVGMGDVLAIQCDVTDSDAVTSAFAVVAERLGPVGILVNSAGVRRDGLAMRMSDDDWRAVIDVNLHGTFHTCRAALPGMVRRRFGRIVNIASAAAYMGAPGQANYAASKAAVVGLTRSLAREVGSRGITCNIVSPGPVETEMIDDLDEQARGRLRDLTALGRFAEPSEVSGVVAFLCSEEASYITGSVIPVDGGIGMGH